jgi:hypothetical protein
VNFKKGKTMSNLRAEIEKLLVYIELELDAQSEDNESLVDQGFDDGYIQGITDIQGKIKGAIERSLITDRQEKGARLSNSNNYLN